MEQTETSIFGYVGFNRRGVVAAAVESPNPNLEMAFDQAKELLGRKGIHFDNPQFVVVYKARNETQAEAIKEAVDSVAKQFQSSNVHFMSWQGDAGYPVDVIARKAEEVGLRVTKVISDRPIVIVRPYLGHVQQLKG